MKVKFSQFIFAILICSSFCNLTPAQEKPVALKFDEFDDSFQSNFYPFEEKTLSARIERFMKQLKKEREIKINLIYYKARITNESNNYDISNWAGLTKTEIRFKTKIKDEDIIIVDGGYKEKATLEYWVVPKNAESPKPKPSFDKSETFFCPSLYISSDSLQFDTTKKVVFSVSTYNFETVENDAFFWKVSAGKIIEGQGWKKITVDLTDSNVKRITAFVEVRNLPYPCNKIGLSTIDVGRKPILFDSAVRYNYSELAARLDTFMNELNNNPTTRGYIIIYANRTRGNKDMERAITSVKRFFTFRKYDLSQITIKRGGFREYDSVDSWILPEGAELPIPTPTLDDKFVASGRVSKKKKSLSKPKR